MTHAVQLYKYDLSHGMARQMSQGMLGFQLEAIWHTSVVVYGREFYFDGGVGIANSTPGQTRFGQPVEVVNSGETEVSPSDFANWVRDQAAKFGPGDYNLLERNCNHFSDDALDFLTGQGVCEEVRTMIPRVLATPLGQLLRPSLETAMMAPGSSPAAATSSQVPPGVSAHANPSEEQRASEVSDGVAALSEHEDPRLALKCIDALLSAIEAARNGRAVQLPDAIAEVPPANAIAAALGLRPGVRRAGGGTMDLAVAMLHSSRESVAELVSTLDASTAD
mmetsp:Transcript_29430/g.90920  ORF Transcript_29430/g.90920 Transcript_29430/m.90920 type:complete len:279 (-) Transcript_29430:91-927(-)|eukprot:CAMPEP_0174851856 /NCGR_PEP_ID=MMETSP1114-20130205/24198_1 /TAXON_ID=312471 /ORGANISM="Neobodo designis, Strain CCAP 1951/1" /LENGTH=278 /DNA_ID=CAMNT_0016086415 /DNA_START=40 /DNA_END=876 /DNA_ORIENTATION=+